MSMAVELLEVQQRVNAVIDQVVPEAAGPASKLLEAMHYSIQGGKRIRAFLVLKAAETFGFDPHVVMPAAIAFELMHAASLIHDDMPCIDDADTRRGISACHMEFDEHTALLAGDALIIKAFELLASLHKSGVSPDRVCRVVEEFAEATGATGLIAGEAADIEGEQRPPDANTLSFIHTNKTGKLIIAAARTGALLAGANDEDLSTLTEYAHHLGLLFQITDDILDETSTEEEMGKPVGADGEAGKMTYPALFGLDEAYQRADEVAASALAAASGLPANVELWNELVTVVRDRRA